MLFQTPEFLVFLLVVLTGLTAIRGVKWQHILLVAASFVFYGWWDVRFLSLIFLTTVVDYSAALGMGGVKLTAAERIKVAVVSLSSVAVFLLPNWPAVQHGGWSGDWTELIGPRWPGGWGAVAAMTAFSLVFPVLYGLYFRLGERARRRAFLITSVVLNLAVLGFFKYFDFASDSVVGIAHMLGFEISAIALHVALPVGISFYTFQSMAYTIDAYRGDIVPERSLLRLLTFVTYFPQLVAGPIIRPQHLLPFLDSPFQIRSEKIRSGFHLALVGLCKKVLIADSVAPVVDAILNDPSGQSSMAIIFATCLFAVQIYCDFSGYTDIARGVSRMMGIEIPLNFDFPYFSTSIIEFWRRWHISLSSWLRDYLYIPLGGSRLGVSRTYFNLMATMVLGGLWHGAAWNFVIWGTYQGALLCINRVIRNWIEKREAVDAFCRTKFGTVMRWAVTAYFWLFGWLIFRVTDTDDLLLCMRKFVVLDGQWSPSAIGVRSAGLMTALIAVAAFAVLHAWGFFGRRWSDRLDTMPKWLAPVAYAGVGLVLFIGWPRTATPFIYFQF
jgi:D-alanyl-lipoteichoic acid acyltransferase DltB (MBOAT superfamily)